MDLNLDGKIALVTGASRGIGLAIARSLAAEGCHLGICARGLDDLRRAEEDLRSRDARVVAVQADMLQPEQAASFVEECANRLGGIDILVNNVGFNRGGDLMHSTDEEWRLVFEANTFQIVRLIRLVVPHMRARGGGAIVNIASISGWEPQLAGTGQYGGSKAATIFLTERFALELVHDNIRVNTVSPGSILFEGGGWDRVRREKPDQFQAYIRDGFPMGRLGRPEEVADVVTFLVSPLAGWINGRHIPVDGLEQPVPVPERRPW
ncbi:MAG: SDR family NAD(P)-dependent oxidoreductase [Anaerolineae bacterium]|jgi:3-oxoacyl-[acyl-carrier protein] reductase